ncbi:MAG: hypothetical protein BWY31_00606 [Lentisphaerae bacterium ADurb.Bin242]|nr:MAG: hypothetical protein BWY31_00606 [Lentisphaerae bacterium ADurb.Bin242]
MFIRNFLNVFMIALAVLTVKADSTFVLAENGKTDWKILHSPEEKFAAEELSAFLEKMTGAKFPVQSYGKITDPSFVLGMTDEAKKAGAEFGHFAPDEWFVKKTGNNIVVCGGKNKGTLYGVYELLEKYGKCSWPAWDVEIVPKQTRFLLPSTLFLCGKPAFVERTIYDGITYGNKKYRKDVIEKKRLFNIRNRETRINGIHQFDMTSSYWDCHNFYLFVPPSEYFKTHPEYYSMNAQGERFLGKNNYSGSQLCLSNPEVARITASALLNYIKADRKKLPKDKWPTVYPVSQLDNTRFICKCPECSRITQREGNESGLIILYLNQVLDIVNVEYPDIKISTLFYVSTEEVPKNLRPHKNLICQWCDLYTSSDCYRPITSKFNTSRKKQLDAWSAVANELAIWDYHNMDGNAVIPPCLETVIDAIAPDLRYFHKKGVTRYFTEMEDGSEKYGVSQIFLDLQYYVGRRLLIATDQNPDVLIEHFMNACYGPAAVPMKKILDRIRDGVRNEQNALPAQIRERSYQTPDFIRGLLSLLDEAIELTTPGSIQHCYVKNEGLMIIATALAKPGLLKGAERQQYITRFRNDAIKRIDSLAAPEERDKMFARLEEQIREYEILQIKVETPKIFKSIPSEQIRVYGWPNFKQHSIRPNENIVVEDSDSPVGKAVVPPAEAETESAYAQYKPQGFGVYDYGTKKGMSGMKITIPQDEKYHWYLVGQADIYPTSFFHAFRWVLQVQLSGVWTPSDGIIDGNKWYVYVSAKFTGPVYVKGSKQKNRLFIDYVVLSKEKIRLPQQE